MINQKFGGPWTNQKLEILQKYLDAYTTALKKRNFQLTYVDAFAGSGLYSSSTQKDQDFQEFHKGSPIIAIDIKDKKFDQLIFIEKEPQNIASLQTLATLHPERNIRIVQGNANEEIPKFCTSMKRLERAVVFLDPFATEVTWSTVEAIAHTQKIDCWILFPISKVTRMMPRENRPDENDTNELNRVFGETSWQDNYQKADQQPLPLPDYETREIRPQGSDYIAEKYMNNLTKNILESCPNTTHFKKFHERPSIRIIFRCK